MRLLLDESTDLRLATLLASQGHQVASIVKHHLPGMSDNDVLALATSEERVLVTEDRDFGELVMQRREPHHGVIYLRLGTASLGRKAERLIAAISTIATDENSLLRCCDKHDNQASAQLNNSVTITNR